MASKIRKQYFECDSSARALNGIFSANYCWPENCEQDLGSKNWSKFMIENNEWFEKKLYKQVVKKIPILTKDGTEQSVVYHINECLFATVLKELDLLTFSQTQYFESIIHLFRDEITFGLSFWLKLCKQFNWRLYYVQLIAEDKQSNTLIELLFKEIEDRRVESVFSGEEISYFDSLIECMALKVIAFDIINDRETDPKLVKILKRCQSHRFGSCLAVFNVLSQVLIKFALNILSRDCICEETVEKQLLSLENLISHSFESIEKEIPLNDKLLSKDISIARDNYDSLQLINENYFKILNKRIELPSLENFYRTLNSESPQELHLKVYDCLSAIISDPQNPNYQQLFITIISFASFEKFESLLKSCNTMDVNRFGLVSKLTERLNISRNESSKIFFSSLLYQSLKSTANIDLKQRLKQFNYKDLTFPNSDTIKTLFNQTISDAKPDLINELNKEFLIGIYFQPFAVYDLILDFALHHNRAQMRLLAKLIAGPLYHLSTYVEMPEKETYLMKFIIHKLVGKQTLQIIDDIIKLIIEINKCSVEEEIGCVLSIEHFFLYIIKDRALANTETVWLKLCLMKQLIELSADHNWDDFNAEPVPTLVFITQYLDYFWRNPLRKQFVIDVIHLIIDRKMTRNLSEEELQVFDEMLSKYFPYKVITASTPKIYLCYFESKFPKPIAELIDLKKNIYHDQILHYATICADFTWICRIYNKYEVFTDDTKIALDHILPALIKNEWNRLFEFLRMFYWNYQVINFLAISIMKQNGDKYDIKFMTQCLIDIVVNYILVPKRDEVVERPLSYEDCSFRKLEYFVIFKSLSTLDFQFIWGEISAPLREVLIELAQVMFNDYICAYDLFDSETKLSPIAKEVLQQVYGHPYPQSEHEPIQQTVALPPAGLQSPQ